MRSLDPIGGSISVVGAPAARLGWQSVAGRVLLLLCLMYLIFYVDRVNISTAAPLIKRDLGLSNTALGFAFSAFAYPYALFQLIGGWLGDRFGPRWTLGVSGLIVCISTALTGAVGGLAALVAVRLALGFGEGAAFPTATRAMATWLPASRWGFAQGVTHSASRIGNALTPPLIAWLITVLSWRGSFVVLGAASLIWMTVWVWFFRDDPRTHPKMTAAELEGLALTRSRAVRPKVPWLRLVPRILPVTAVDFCYGWTLWLFLSWIPSFFFHNFHLNLVTFGAVFFGCLPVRGRWRHAWRRRQRPYFEADRQSAPSTMRGDRQRFVRRVPFHDPGSSGARSCRRCSLSVAGILLRRTGRRPDLGGADGHCSSLCRLSERDHEFRLWYRRNYFAFRVRLCDRCDR